MKQLYLKKKIALLMTGVISMTIAQPIWAQNYSNHWAEKSLTTWEQAAFMLKDAEGKVQPKEYVSRDELVQFVAEAFGLVDETFLKSYMGSLIDEQNTVVNPKAIATREEAAYVLARTYKMKSKSMEPLTYTHEIAALIEAGIILGDKEEGINPKGLVTKAQLITMFDRLTAEVYSQSGTYSQDIQGNLIINTSDIVLKNMTVEGNLYITQGVGQGKVMLDNVKVTGKVYIEGGGMDSIHLLNGTQLNEVQVNKLDGKVKLVSDENSGVKYLELLSGAIINTNVQEMKILKPTLSLIKPIVEVDRNIVIDKVVCDTSVKLTGEGRINQLTVNVNGVEVSVKVNEIVLGKEGLIVNTAEGFTSQDKESSSSNQESEEDNNSSGDGNQEGDNNLDEDDENNGDGGDVETTTSSALVVDVTSLNFSKLLNTNEDLALTLTLKGAVFNTEDQEKIKEALILNIGTDFNIVTTGSSVVLNQIVGVEEKDFVACLEITLGQEVLNITSDLTTRIELINDVEQKPDIPLHPNANKHGSFTEPFFTESFMKGGQQYYLIQLNNGIEITQRCANEFNKTLKNASSLDGSPMYMASSRDKLYFRFFPYGDISGHDVWTITLPDWATTAGEEVIFQVPIIH